MYKARWVFDISIALGAGLLILFSVAAGCDAATRMPQRPLLYLASLLSGGVIYLFWFVFWLVALTRKLDMGDVWSSLSVTAAVYGLLLWMFAQKVFVISSNVIAIVAAILTVVSAIICLITREIRLRRLHSNKELV